ncbi:Ig-like domain-containing protein [uncultured Agrococcus sp.]|uniref:fibronectin type III domain-containing protein n=1 Tax=uncultured Agrococcus sp. TaxID=382258 RepID=UPI0025E16F70|nr:Ig-like domain-containing protein [uncultured Agrococcus sp.]
MKTRPTKRIIGAVVGFGLALAVVIAAVAIPGYQSLRPTLDPGTVWVANGGSGQLAAANTRVEQLQDITRVTSGTIRIVQNEEAVLVADSTNGTVRGVDPATGELAPAVPIPPNAELQIRDERVLVTDPTTGDIIVTTFDAILAGEPLSDPVLELGRGSVAVLGETKLFVASPGLARVVEYDFERGESTESHRATISPTDPELQLTALGDTWVLYDATSNTVSTSSWNRQLDFEGVRLQQPGGGSGALVIATQDAVIRLTVGATAEEVLVAGMTGSASSPLVREGCVYAVWSSGAAWNECAQDGLVNLQEVPADASLQLQARGTAVVATDAASGSTWSLHGSGEIIDDWLEPVDEQLPDGDGQQDFVPETDSETAQRPPVAQDDEFGARPGRVTVLPVTRNDSDPNNDPLIISEVLGHDGASVTADGQSIRLEVGEEENDTIDLEYTLSDGRGGQDTAAVEVSLSEDDENGAPEQIVETTLVAQSGSSVSVDALADWVDPDGDPLTLVSVAAEEPDSATARPDGRLELHDGGAGGVRHYGVTVSDGTAVTEGTVSVSTTASPVLTAEPVTVSAVAGQSIEIEPLLSARGGEGQLRLHNVEPPQELEHDVSYESGTVRVTPTEEGDVTFPYVVTDGSATQQGVIRVVTGPPETASTPPQPVPSGLSLPPLGSTELDIASSTADLAGGSLVVTSVGSDSPALRATLVDLGVVHIELTAPLASPATVTYTLSNGTSSAEGTIVVSEGETSAQAPIARNDSVRAAPGQSVAVSPLANDEHPDMGPLELLPDLVSEPTAGVMFTRGDSIIFLAPEQPGTYEGVYEVEGPDGQRATASVIVTVGTTGGDTNQGPEAPRLDARVMEGQTVDITVPLAGSDPNGDPVQLLGPSSTPTLGTLSRLDATTFRYTAGDLSSGTDRISYLISDDKGEQSEGVLTIAVADRNDTDAQPRAEHDAAEMQPSTTLAVDVLANDVDSANLPLSISNIDVMRGDGTAEVQDDRIVVEAGATEGEIAVFYTVENSLGMTSVAWLNITVDEEAVPPAPVAGDIDVPLRSVIDDDSVTVRPLEVASVADGRNDLLEVEVAGGGDDVQVRGDGSLDVPVQETARELAYRVTRTDTGDVAYGLIRMPGTRDALPQLRDDVDPIEVASGESVEIDINEYIVAATGLPVLITDASRIRSTNGEHVVRDSQIIEFTPTTGYFGPANISLEVTDGNSPQDPDGRVGYVVLPITVIGGEDVPPTLLGTTFTLEPGETRTIDLTRITLDPAARPDRLEYAVLEEPGNGVQLTQEGGQLTMSVDTRAQPGSTESATLGVSSGDNEGQPGTLNFAIVTSTMPLVQPVTDSVDLQRGESQSLSPLTNDEATNPFPEPLLIDLVEAPSQQGVDAQLSGDGRSVVVSASGQAPVETVQVRYRVLDGTRDLDRAVWGTIRVNIQDVPDRPGTPQQVTERFEVDTLFVSVSPPDDNNSALTSLVLRDQFGDEYACSLEGDCTVRGLERGVDYRFTAVAANALGSSEPSQQSAPMHIDALPNPVNASSIEGTPTSTPGTMRLTWDAATVPRGGTPVNGYIVRVSGQGANFEREVGANTQSLNVPGLTGGRTYDVEIAATNSAGVSDDMWRFSDVHPMTAVGRPGTTAIDTEDYEPGEPEMVVRWGSVTPGGGERVRYRVQVIEAGQEDSHRCRSTGEGQTGRSAEVEIPDGQDSVIVVVADNGWFCSMSFSETLTGAPEEVSGEVPVTVEARDDAADPQVESVPVTPNNHRIQARLTNGSNETPWVDVRPGTFLNVESLGYGSSLSVEVRQCAQLAGMLLCGAASDNGDVVPFSLDGQFANGCSWGEQLETRLPQNSVGATTTGLVEVQVDGEWERLPEDETVPFGATDARVTTTVEYQGATYTDQTPNSAGNCSA